MKLSDIPENKIYSYYFGGNTAYYYRQKEFIYYTGYVPPFELYNVTSTGVEKLHDSRGNTDFWFKMKVE